MKTPALLLFVISGLGMGLAARLPAAGPFDPDQWPSIVDPNKTVHFTTTDGSLAPPGAGWSTTLTILSGGDQGTVPITLRARQGLKAQVNYLNTADSGYTEWADNETVDILIQVYGDGAILDGAGQPRNYNFLIGTLPFSELSFPVGGQIPATAQNQKWNWVLFRITNSLRASDGQRFLGSLPPNSQGANQFGGVNGGTIRMEGVPNLIVRAIAFGEQGAFGEPTDYLDFEPPDTCDPEPPTNRAFIDLAHNTADHLTVLNAGDQTTEIIDDAGPAEDQRRAVRALENYMNFAITDNYLGQACNDARAIKVCVEFYDDPALIGVRFGPEAYSTDAVGSIGVYPSERRYALRGTGRWMSISWIVPSVSLFGVNVAPLTAGPRLFFEGGHPAISRYDLAIFRLAPHPLAGQDPLADCFEDPDICTGVYGSFAEMNLAAGILNGLSPGTSVGDQNMIQEEAGPVSDRRVAIRPAFNDGTPDFVHQYLNFAITSTDALGPSTQPNARLAIVVTYYDDPALIGKTFRPEVYQSDRNGATVLAFTTPDIAVALQGTDRWKEAYFEIPDMKFNGVNQGPQAAARFVLSDKIFFSRVRYAIVRPCGPDANVNRLAESRQPTLHIRREGDFHRLSWSSDVEGWTLETTSDLTTPNWTAVQDPPFVEGDENVVFAGTTGQAFFRLRN